MTRRLCITSLAVLAGTLLGIASHALADETCMSPYMAKIVGQEDVVYVWTLGVPGVGDEQDKLVTVDVKPGSKTYGKVVSKLSVGGATKPITPDSPTTAAISGPPGSTPARSSSSTCTPIPQRRLSI